jgi:hypothetical protein
MLTEQYVGDPSTVREALLSDFSGRIEAADLRQRDLGRPILFGTGGLYEDRLLEVREDLLHMLESAVQGVARDLELLNRSLVRVLADPW